MILMMMICYRVREAVHPPCRDRHETNPGRAGTPARTPASTIFSQMKRDPNHHIHPFKRAPPSPPPRPESISRLPYTYFLAGGGGGGGGVARRPGCLAKAVAPGLLGGGGGGRRFPCNISASAMALVFFRSSYWSSSCLKGFPCAATSSCTFCSRGGGEGWVDRFISQASKHPHQRGGVGRSNATQNNATQRDSTRPFLFKQHQKKAPYLGDVGDAEVALHPRVPEEQRLPDGEEVGGAPVEEASGGHARGDGEEDDGEDAEDELHLRVHLWGDGMGRGAVVEGM